LYEHTDLIKEHTVLMLNNLPEPTPTGQTLIVTGSHGLIGRRVVQLATAAGIEVKRLSYKAVPPTGEHSYTQPTEETRAWLNGATACIHLAGEPILGYWTPRKKAAVVTSRTQGARQLCELLVSLAQPPKQLVSASAIGFYGNRGQEVLTEASPSGEGFLADTCQQWEAATNLAAHAGIAVAHARVGVVLSPEGGALKAMLPAFKLGIAGRLGDGTQGMSWIHIDDMARALLWLAMPSHPSHPSHPDTTKQEKTSPPLKTGAYNMVAPQAVSNAVFTQTLAKVVRRPACLPAPAMALRLLLGELSAVLLHSQYVQPTRLSEEGFAFAYPGLDEALTSLV
jgi:uncharacterized protein (TIGR01777 family)